MRYGEQRLQQDAGGLVAIHNRTRLPFVLPNYNRTDLLLCDRLPWL